MRVIGVGAIKALKEIFLPALMPAVPMVMMIYLLQQAIEPSSPLSIMAVAGIGLLVYVIGYLSVGASQVERQTCRSFVVCTVQFAKARLKFS